MFLFYVTHDGADAIGKTNIKHSIRLIQYHSGNVVQIQILLLKVFLNSPRGADDDMGLMFQ